MKTKINEQIREVALISEVIGTRISLVRRGRKVTALCPFHADTNPSMHISDEKGIFKCFSCQAGGDVIKFVMDYDKISFKATIEKLAKDYNIELPNNWSRQEAEPKTDPHKAMKALNAFAAEVYHRYLLEHREAQSARKYLAKRGINPEGIKAFKLGFAPKNRNILTRILQQEGMREQFPENLLKQSTLFHTADTATTGKEKPQKPESPKNPITGDFFNNRVIFPIFNENQEVLGFGGRAMDNHPAKYMNSRESDWFLKYEILYGIREAYQNMVRTKEVFVVEGYLDVLAMQAIGLPAVSPLGTAITVEQLRKLKRYVRKVYFLFDGDDAGEKAAFHGSSLAAALEMDGGVYELPKGQDPFDFILAKRGDLAEIATDLKEHYVNIYDYLIEGPTHERTQERSPVTEKEALERLIPVYIAIKDPVVKNIFKEKIRARFNTEPEEVIGRKRFISILKSYTNRGGDSQGDSRRVFSTTSPASERGGRSHVQGAVVPVSQPIVSLATDRRLREEELVLFIAKRPKLLSHAASILYPVDIEDARTRFIYEKILHLKNDPNPQPTHVLDLFKNQDMIDYLLKHLMEERSEEAPEEDTNTLPEDSAEVGQIHEFRVLYSQFKLIEARDKKIQLHLKSMRLEEEGDENLLRENQEALLKVDVEQRNFQEFLSREQIYSKSTTPHYITTAQTSHRRT